MTRADVCLNVACRYMGIRDSTDPAPERCPRCGGELLKPARRPTLVELVARRDPIGDA